MKPRRDRSGAFMRPMASDVRSEIFGCAVIGFPPIERAACSRITPRWAHYCIAAPVGGGGAASGRRRLIHASDYVSAMFTAKLLPQCPRMSTKLPETDGL